MSTQTPAAPARGAARRTWLPWWLAAAALVAFAAGLGIGIWRIHEHNSGSGHSALATNGRGWEIPNSGGFAGTDVAPADVAAASQPIGAVVNGPVTDAVQQAHLRQEAAAEAAQITAAQPAAASQPIPRGGEAEAIDAANAASATLTPLAPLTLRALAQTDTSATAPQLALYIVNTQADANDLETGLTADNAIRATGGVPALQFAIVVSSADAGSVLNDYMSAADGVSAQVIDLR
ncbi:MAG TPA: hypothetical protein VKV26_03405 [Dehalococcoidia bacterium]|nr:hypothetical protein [Dehalococcoidia bacterium]